MYCLPVVQRQICCKAHNQEFQTKKKTNTENKYSNLLLNYGREKTLKILLSMKQMNAFGNDSLLTTL